MLLARSCGSYWSQLVFCQCLGWQKFPVLVLLPPPPPPGPLSGTSDEENLRKLEKDKKAFGSHDIHSHQVIGNLKKVTIALEGGGGGGEEGEEEGVEPQSGEESSLDFISLDKPQRRQYG